MNPSAQVTMERAVVEKPGRRRRSVAEKQRIVEETFAPGMSVARVARAHDVNANLVFTWRRRYQRGRLGGRASTAALVPVKVTDAPVAAEAASSATPAGSIQLRLPKGQLRLDGNADPVSLRIILECLLG